MKDVTALDVEVGMEVMLLGEWRRITATEVHMSRGDGIPDGYVRLSWNGGSVKRLADGFLKVKPNEVT